jgi:hypothetical protein
LGNDETKRLSQACPDDLLLVLGENANNSFDGFCRIDSVQRGKYEVPGLGCLKRDFHSFAITHLANQDYFWSLSQCGAQSEGKVGRV